MQKLIFSDLKKSIDDVFHDVQNFSLSHASFLLEERAEVSLIAKLGDDIAMRGFPDDIEAFEDVGVLQLGECFDLAIEHLPTDGIANPLHIDGLDGHCLVYIE
jgi:hypothetical protein